MELLKEILDPLSEEKNYITTIFFDITLPKLTEKFLYFTEKNN
jgi:hypothetical protein